MNFRNNNNRRRKKVFFQKKNCRFCVDKIEFIDYKDIKVLRALTTDLGRIIPRRISGNCAKHQRVVTVAIKRARTVALLPFAAER